MSLDCDHNSTLKSSFKLWLSNLCRASPWNQISDVIKEKKKRKGCNETQWLMERTHINRRLIGTHLDFPDCLVWHCEDKHHPLLVICLASCRGSYYSLLETAWGAGGKTNADALQPEMTSRTRLRVTASFLIWRKKRNDRLDSPFESVFISLAPEYEGRGGVK